MPKQRTLPYIIMGLINISSIGKLTGSQIYAEFNDEIGEFWKASHSQIYPELKRMVDDGWLEVNQLPDNDKEKLYQLTSAGLDILNDWLAQPVNNLPLLNDPFSLKLYFIKDKKDPRLIPLINQRIKLLEEQIVHLKDRQAQVFKTEADQEQNFGHYLILQRALSRQTSLYEWLQQIRLQLK